MVNRLEALELQGLKTFATTTRLEFPGRITAIVGPNGSGKSNIADSIRWVLGEQSYSLLRAKRTDDMIFSGSQQRSRAGMASATIIFNNQDGWLPIDFSEVSISRRAYRDGQNEYLLNGQKVRLKDIVELLSQTGLSERTYTIIGQGLVDVALALKPDERVKLFEEAAGIGLYRTRKEESLRRLENTRKNLDRVLDIMTEIRPRVRSLEKQAKRFEEYQHLRSDLQLYLREWYGYHWHNKQQDLRNIRNSYQDQEKRLIALRRKYAETENKVEEARQQLQVNRKALQLAHHELSDHHRKFEQANRELAIIDERQRSNAQQKSNLEIDVANVQEEIRELKSQEENYRKKIDLRTTDFEAAAEEVNQVEIKLSDISGKKEIKENALATLRKKRVALETENVQIAAHLEELTKRVESQTNEKLKIKQSIQSLEKEKLKTSENAALQAKMFKEANNKLENLQNQVVSKSDQIEAVRLERQGFDHQLGLLETHQAKLQAQLDVLIQAEAALSGYSEGSKTVVENSRKGRLPTGIEPLIKFIVVDERYEQAISAALGELSDLLIIPSGGKDKLIEYLESKSNDRVALVVMERSKSNNKAGHISREDGFIGYANELIQVAPEYRGLVDNLFSDTLIMADKQSAQEVQSRLNPMEQAVTLNGLVFKANGIILSGQSASGKRIGRPRRKNELQQGLIEIAENFSKMQESKRKVESDLQQLKKEHKSLVLDLNLGEEIKNKARQRQQEAKDSLTRMNEQLVWLDERKVSIQENILETTTAIKTEEDRLKDTGLRIEEMLDEEKKLFTVLNQLPVFEIQQELNHWKTHQIVTQNALEAARQRYHDHENRIDNAQKRLETYQTRLEDLKKRLLEVKQNEDELRRSLSDINQSIETIKTERINPLTSAVEADEKTVSASEKLEAHSHQQVIIAERHFTQLQLELSRRNDQLDNLRERIEDDFGLVSFDYAEKMDGPTPLPFDDDLIENLPRVQTMSDSLEDEINRLKSQVRRMGAINPDAQQEYFEVNERYEFLTNQINDLEKASKDLREVITALDSMMARDFIKTFKAVDQEFSDYFSRLFNGGKANLMFVDEENPVEGGVDIEARLPGRRRQGLAALSGGERSLTAVALIFALLKVSPTPFCILDEVDAMLDESNVGRFIELLHELSQKTQFVIITHNRNTVQAADVIYGVTMGRDSTSQMISLKLEEVNETYLE
jgi:chromosome segregation protein